MTPTDVHNTYKQVLSYLSQGRLKNAFEKTENLNTELQSILHRESLQNPSQNLFHQGSVHARKEDDKLRIVPKGKRIAFSEFLL